MTSLARRHREKAHAELLARAQGIAATAGLAPAIDTDAPEASEYALLMVSLEEYRRQLSEIQSIEARNPKKAEMATTFASWILGVLEAGKAGNATQDEIVTTNMIWAMDYGNYDYALDLAEHVLAHGLVLPERYNRTAGCLIAEEIAEAVIAGKTAVTHAQLLRAASLTAAQDMPDQARAKMMKALAFSYAAEAEAFDATADNAVAGGKPALLTAAIDHFARALQLHPKISGVKQRLKESEKLLETLGGRPFPQLEGAGEDDDADASGDGSGGDASAEQQD